jgi:hypothetical protein
VIGKEMLGSIAVTVGVAVVAVGAAYGIHALPGVDSPGD